MKTDLSALCRRLAYDFQDITLLDNALSHRSVSADNNERLEFLGDSIVNFIVAEALFRQFPAAQEGQLSRMRASLVRGDTLAVIARDLQVGDYLRLGAGELKSGGFRRYSILADALEAIIAAIYLDSDFYTTVKVVSKWFRQALTTVSEVKDVKDAKTRLQEYLQARRLPLPTYAVRRIEGKAHEQIFFVDCYVDTVDYVAEGEAGSRRAAEQIAAEDLLEYLMDKDAND